ncbi:hypothetical protein HGM15179_022291 [Zosterops borbonicus]|uniref:Uncharacterized protein n=1 Tax=Zosterops borbonicus TaxID=364589 RepID=A0A8K1D6M8_9PASS|nr:hypothetical protein HGM15179_022291 [Zosterops borbonicus]
METVKKLLEAQAPRAAGHPTQSTSQICPVDLEQWEEELVQALSSEHPELQGKAAWLKSSWSFVAATSPKGLCQSHSLLCPAALGHLELLLDTGVLRSPLGMYPTSWTK